MLSGAIERGSLKAAGEIEVAAQTYKRVILAAEQLDVGISLFLEGQSLVSAMTLAGAAEEIFGKALTHGGQQHSLDWKYEAVEPTHTILYRKPLSKKEFFEAENRARNAAKHMSSANEPSVNIDLEDAAIWMIVRACDNSNRLNLQRSPNMLAFEDWFYEHVVGY